MALILLVEKDKLQRWALTKQLEELGHTVHDAASIDEASPHVRQHQPDILLIARSLPDGRGLDFCRRHAADLATTGVILMSAVGRAEDAAEALNLGAAGFLTKPLDLEELHQCIHRSLRLLGDRKEARAARQSREREMEQVLVADSPAFREILHTVHDLATSDVHCILIQGERCAGKKALAAYLHAISNRRDKPLLKVRCHATPGHILESDLFGENGEPQTQQQGFLELADGGTLILDEVAHLPLQTQARVLEVIEQGRLRRNGSLKEIATDVRIVAITNRDLENRQREGKFSKNLLHRLIASAISLPSLREHPEDILPLANHYLEQFAPRFDQHFTGFSPEAENHLIAHSWPGNVCELRQIVERAMILATGPEIGPESLILSPVEKAPESDLSGFPSPSDTRPLEEIERDLVNQALQATKGHRTRAAALLGISRDQLRYRLRKFDLDK